MTYVHFLHSPSPEFLDTGSFSVLTAVSPVASASCDASELQEQRGRGRERESARIREVRWRALTGTEL
jgi:hypothetical protein